MLTRVKMGIVSLLLVFAVTPLFGIKTADARLASNNRNAVVLEAFYALSPDHSGFTNKQIWGSVVGVWNYLDNDHNAYENVKKAYPKPYASKPVLWPSADQNLFYDNSAQLGYANLRKFGIYNNSTNDKYGAVGRGGQCKFFVDTLLFRSESAARIDNGTHVLPLYSVMNDSSDTSKAKPAPIGKARPGDVIFIPNNGHTALVVAILAGDPVAGTVSEVDVVDSNFVAGDGNEVIARHRLRVTYAGGTSDLAAYKIYTGVSYYGEDYKPW